MIRLKQSLKIEKQNHKKRLINKRNLSIVRTYIKKFLKFIDNSDFGSAYKFYPNLVSKIDKSVIKGIFHKNKAARLKRKFNFKLKKGM